MFEKRVGGLGADRFLLVLALVLECDTRHGGQERDRILLRSRIEGMALPSKQENYND
jgi:hypothetical protein